MAAIARTVNGLAALIALLPVLCAEAPSRVLQSAHAKIERIENDQAARGSGIILSAGELLAYASEQAEVIAPGAVHRAVLLLTPGHAQTTADINFLRVRQAEGRADSWLMQKLLDGERQVRIRIGFESSQGRARVSIERVEVSGVGMEGTTLSFLLRQFIIPNFPDARVGAWFELRHNIERLEVIKDAVRVVIRK